MAPLHDGPPRVEGVAVGRIVHFVPPQGQGYRTNDVLPATELAAGIPRHLAAIITRVWGPTDSTVNLTVFPDGTNDFDSGGGNIATSLVRWETSVIHDSKGETPRSWHFPEGSPSAGVIQPLSDEAIDRIAAAIARRAVLR